MKTPSPCPAGRRTAPARTRWRAILARRLFWRFWARCGAALRSRACGRTLCQGDRAILRHPARAAARASSGRTPRRLASKNSRLARRRTSTLADCPGPGPRPDGAGRCSAKARRSSATPRRLRVEGKSDRIAAMQQEAAEKLAAELSSRPTGGTVTRARRRRCTARPDLCGPQRPPGGHGAGRGRVWRRACPRAIRRGRGGAQELAGLFRHGSAAAGRGRWN